MDKLKQVLNMMAGILTPADTANAKVDYAGLIAELKQTAHAKSRDIGGKTYAPSDYYVQLSPRDMEELREGELDDLIVESLQKGMEAYIRERKFMVRGPVSVRLGEDERLGEGYVAVTVSFAPAVTSNDPSGVHSYAQPGAAPRLAPSSQPPKVNTPKAAFSQSGMSASPTSTVNMEEMTVIRAPLGAVSAYFEVVKGDISQQGKHLAIPALPALIGRLTPNNKPDVGVLDATNMVGRQHAQIARVDGKYTLQERSKNGTSINGRKLSEGEVIALEDGAELVLGGRVRLKFHTGDRTVIQQGHNQGQGAWSA